MSEASKSILKIQNLWVHYLTLNGPIEAVREISLEVYQEEIYGIVGESGCGKSTLAFAIMGYLGENGRIVKGDILFDGQNLVRKSENELRAFRGKDITMVYQDPSSALNPAMVVGEQIAEVSRIHKGLSVKESWQDAISILENLNMPDPENIARHYPHQISGGMQQRICIGMALISNPSLLIMDEPTTNLDVTTEAVILDLIQELKRKFNTAIIYISHDLGVIAKVANRIGVMYMGKLVEEGFKEDIFLRPLHPYTIGLMNCIPKVGLTKKNTHLQSISGRIPHLTNLPAGCIFRPRCFYAREKCAQSEPKLMECYPGHRAACWMTKTKQKMDLQIIKKTSEPTSRTLLPCSDKDKSLLEVKNLKKYYETKHGLLSTSGKQKIKALDGVNLAIKRSQTLGVVGESGCGKTTLARCIIGLLSPTDGKIYFGKEDITLPWNKRNKALLKEMQMIFQNPENSLNPAYTVKRIIARSLQLHNIVKHSQLDQHILELLKRVGLHAEYMNRYSRQMSGGEKQRVAIARAFASNPEFIICDEPTSSLDVSVQASILNLLIELQEKAKTSYLFISHDLNVVHYFSDYIAVIYMGKLCEFGPSESIFAPPYHPYTEALLSAIPIPDPRTEQAPIRLAGSVPSAINPPSGCRFHTRCPRKIGPICESKKPPPVKVGENHVIYCHITLPELQKIKTVISFRG